MAATADLQKSQLSIRSGVTLQVSGQDFRSASKRRLNCVLFSASDSRIDENSQVQASLTSIQVTSFPSQPHVPDSECLYDSHQSHLDSTQRDTAESQRGLCSQYMSPNGTHLIPNNYYWPTPSIIHLQSPESFPYPQMLDDLINYPRRLPNTHPKSQNVLHQFTRLSCPDTQLAVNSKKKPRSILVEPRTIMKGTKSYVCVIERSTLTTSRLQSPIQKWTKKRNELPRALRPRSAYNYLRARVQRGTGRR